MTRATRVSLWLAIFLVAYFLALFAFIPVPFFSKEHAEEILPVVRSVFLLPPVLNAEIMSSYHGGCSFPSVHTHSGHSDMASTHSGIAQMHIRSY